MALSDVIKKKQNTGNENDAQGKAKTQSILDDVRVVIAIIALSCVALIVLIVFGTQNINTTKEMIEKAKTEYRDNQLAIANLKALQAQSGEYKSQIEAYEIMLKKEPINQMNIMIDLEKKVEAHNCKLTELTFGEVENTGLVNQVAVTLSISGNYNDIMTFCRDIVSEDEIKRIDTINMTGDSSERTAQIVIVEFSR